MSGCKTFTKMGSYSIDFEFLPNETQAGLLKSINAALSRAEVAISEMRVCKRSLLGGITRGQRHITRNMVIEEERRSQM